MTSSKRSLCFLLLAASTIAASTIAASTIAGCGADSDGVSSSNPDAATADNDSSSTSDGATIPNDASVGDAGAGSDASGIPIPATMFGMDANKLASVQNGLQIPYGGWRAWDDPGQHWPGIATCNPALAADVATHPASDPLNSCYDWSHFDPVMGDIKVADILYTMSRTPLWAVNLASDPEGLSGTDCNYSSDAGTGNDAPGQCLLPSDINADGSGTNQVWRDWVTALATHVNASGWSDAHARIKYWEPWNEFFRSTVIAGNSGNQSFEGTYAQMLRLLEDTRCIVVGTGTVHNYPTQGNSASCASAGFTKTGIDPTALIVAPDGYSGEKPTIDPEDKVLANLLHCSQDPKAENGTATTCTWSGGLDWGANAVDVINWHDPAKTITPEYKYQSSWVAAKGLLTAGDLAKPLMCGECSWGDNRSGLWDHNANNQAAYVPRWIALQVSAGFTFNEWYTYDNIDDGALFDPVGGTLRHPVADAWTQTYHWLLGSYPDNKTFCTASGTVWACPFTKASGQKAELVWDTQYGPGGTTAPADCSQAATPLICGSTSYDVPTAYAKDWITLDGTVSPFQANVTIGAVPILLEGN